MLLDNFNGYFAYMIQIATILFYIASAMGATVIVAKGDIFLPFRTWVFSKTKKNKFWVHDVTLPSTAEIVGVKVNGVEDNTNVAIDDIGNFLRAKSSLFGFVTTERLLDFSVRIFIHSREKVSIEFICNSFPVSEFKAGTYEKYDKVKWVSFIHDMISCPQCCGVWIGMIWYSLYRLGAMDTFIFQMLCAGCVVSLFASMYWKTHDILNNYANKK